MRGWRHGWLVWDDVIDGVAWQRAVVKMRRSVELLFSALINRGTIVVLAVFFELIETIPMRGQRDCGSFSVLHCRGN